MEPIYTAIRVLAETEAEKAVHEGRSSDAANWMAVCKRALECHDIWHQQANALAPKGGA